MEVSTLNIALYRWLEPFLAGIRNKGFTVSPDTHIQLVKVLEGMSDRINTADDLYDYIAPILAKSGEQRLQLRHEFDKFYAEKIQEGLPAKLPKPPLPSPPPLKRKWIYYVLAALLPAIILHVVFRDAKTVVEAKYQIQSPNLAKPVVFDASLAFSNVADTVLADYRWDFGDGSQDHSGKSTVVHQYARAGLYKTSLRIIDKSGKLDIKKDFVVQELRLCKPQIFLESDAGIELPLHESATFTPIYDASFPPGDSNTWLLNGTVIQRNVAALTWKFDSAGLQTISYIDEHYDGLGDCSNNQADKPIYVKPTTNITADIMQAGEVVKPPVKMNRMFMLFGSLVLAGSLFGYLWAWNKTILQKKLEKTKPEDILDSFKGTKPPYEIPFKNYEDIIDDEPYISALARNLKRRMPDESSYINIPFTIRETIRSEGLIMPYYSYNTRPIEYLVLIDRTKTNNQQVKLFEYLLNRFIKTDLFIEIFYYSGQPNTCVNEKYPNGIKLTRLFDIYSRNILIVFGEGQTFIKKTYPAIDEELALLIAKWEHRILVTPKPFVDWDYKEDLLKKVFEVLPADLEGQLLLFAKQEGLEYNFQEYVNRLKKSYTLAPYDFYDVADLEKYLDHPFLFQWLCALAIYPALRWQVMLAIGDGIQQANYRGQTINYTLLLKLVRIPWMTEGSMPDDTRLELLKQLEPANELIARRTMIKVMNEAAAKLDDKSFVYEQMEMQRITDKFMLFAQNPNDPEHLAYANAYGQFKLLWSADHIQDYPLTEYLKKEDEAGNWSTLIGNRELSAEPAKSDAIDHYLDESIHQQKKRWDSWRRITFSIALAMLILLIGLWVFKNEVNGTGIDRALNLTDLDEDFEVPVSFGYIANECFSAVKAGQDSTKLVLTIGDTLSINLSVKDTVMQAQVPYAIYKLGKATLSINSNDPQYVFDSSFNIQGSQVRVQYTGCPVICNNWQLLVNRSVPAAIRGAWYNAGILNGTADSYQPLQISANNINNENVEQVYSCASDPKMFKLISVDDKKQFKAYIINRRTDLQKLGIFYNQQGFSSIDEANQFASKVRELASYVNLENGAGEPVGEQPFVESFKGKWQRNNEVVFELEQGQVLYKGSKIVLQNISSKIIGGKVIYSMSYSNNVSAYGSSDSMQLSMIPTDSNHMFVRETGSSNIAQPNAQNTDMRGAFYMLTDSSTVKPPGKEHIFQPANLPSSLDDIWIGITSKRLFNINTSKKLMYYSTGDEQTYGIYPISDVRKNPGGTYKIISIVNGIYHVFFLQQVAGAGFNLAVCLQLRNMTLQQVQQMDDSNCDIYHRMRLLYPTNANRIYLPNNSRSLAGTERNKWAEFSKQIASAGYKFQAYVNNDYLTNLDIDAVCRMLPGLQKQYGSVINSFRQKNNPFGRSYVEMTVDDTPTIPPETVGNVTKINTPSPRKYKPFSEAMFKSRLEDVIIGKSNLNEFDDYLCDGSNTTVSVNGVRTTFSSLYKSLAGSSRQITAVGFTEVYQYNDDRRCIKELSVTHKAKSAASKY